MRKIDVDQAVLSIQERFCVGCKMQGVFCSHCKVYAIIQIVTNAQTVKENQPTLSGLKTPEQIKKGLRCNNCEACPYFYLRGRNCLGAATVDALVYMNQLENKICELTEKIAQLEAALPKWISVEERLPEKNGQQCVCLYNHSDTDKSVLFEFVFTWYACGDNGYINGPHFTDEGLYGRKVHYWMPIPEPPKEVYHD